MARSSGQKLKLIYLMKIFLENTDNEHAISMKEIIAELGKYGISAERKSIYDDIAALREYGLDIETVRGKSSAYYVANRLFQLPELKLLVDAIQGSKFLTHKKSNELIKKVESFASIYEAQLLQRQVYVANRIKTMNESIYYNIDTLHTAISSNHQISFLYYEWVVDFSQKDKIVKRLKKDGERYQVSPWALTWDDENYYLVAYDSKSAIIKHFRVDKMGDILIEDLAREGKQNFNSFDMAVYSKKIFGMFGGSEETVQLNCHNSLIGVIIDRFGKDVFISPAEENYFNIAVKVVVSPQFIGWLMGFGDLLRVVSPKWLQEDVCKHASKILQQYKD